MPQFTFNPDLDVDMMPTVVSQFLEIVGYDSLKRRIGWIENRMEENRYAFSVIGARQELTFILWYVVSRFREYGRLPPIRNQDGILQVGQLRGYAFMWLLVKVYGFLDERARRRLKGRIQHGFNDEGDLLSVEHELSSIAHLCRFNCAVTCHDMESGGGFDFLATRDGLEFEVECKMVSADKGRQIHQHDTMRLGDHVERAVDWPAMLASQKGVFAAVTVTARLPRNPVTLKAIAEDVATAIKSGSAISRNGWRVEIQEFDVAKSPFASWTEQPDMDTVHKLIDSITDRRHDKLFMHAVAGQAAMVVSVLSDKPDTVVDSVYQELKQGSKQLSGARPGMIFAAFQDMTPEDIVSLGENPGNGLQAMATRLFANSDRRHVYGVTFLSAIRYSGLPGGEMTTDGKVYRFVNSDNPWASERRLRLA